MKAALLLVLSLSVSGCCRPECATRHPACETSASVALFPVNPHGKFGYIDASGAIVIEPRFDVASDFYGDRALVGFGGTWGRPETWAFLDAQGVTTPATREEVKAFARSGDPSDELMQATRKSEIVYLDRAGRVAWAPEYALQLDDADWQFDKERASLEAAIATHKRPYTFQMLLSGIPTKWPPDPPDVEALGFGMGGTLEVWKDGTRIARIPCQTWGLTVFVVDGDTLYYADPAGLTTGCVAGAVDLTNGRHRWRTILKALRPDPLNHSLYCNQVNLRLDDGTLYVSASESGAQGDYVEALDPHTGAIIGRHRR